MDLRDYLRIIRSHWLALVLFTVVGVGVAYGWSLIQPRVYTADASGFITAGSSGNLADASIGDSYAKSRAASYLDIAKSRTVADFVIDELRLETSPSALVQHISVTNPLDSVIIKVSANAGSPEAASLLANTWMQGIVRQVSEVENAGGEGAGIGESVVKLIPVDSAVLPSSPSSPNLRLAVAIGALAGLAIGSGYSALRHTLDRRIRTADTVEKELDVPVIGTIPADKRMTTGNRLAASQFNALRAGGSAGEAAVGEAFRQLRTNLRYMNIDNPPRVIVVTSPLPGDGKSTVASNLAIAIAASGQTVFLIDGDLRRPTVATTFGLPDGAGLTDVLIGTATVDDVVHPIGVDKRLHVIPAGNIPPNPTELLGSQTMHRLLATLAKEGTVLIDAPPLLPVTDGAVLAANTDGALVVGSAGKTTFDQLTKAVGHLNRVNSTALGIIINRVSRRGPDRAEYYQYDYSSKPASTKHKTAAP